MSCHFFALQVGYLGYEPHTVHRLDMYTSGAVCFAKDKATVQALHHQFQRKTMAGVTAAGQHEDQPHANGQNPEGKMYHYGVPQLENPDEEGNDLRVPGVRLQSANELSNGSNALGQDMLLEGVIPRLTNQVPIPAWSVDLAEVLCFGVTSEADWVGPLFI